MLLKCRHIVDIRYYPPPLFSLRGMMKKKLNNTVIANLTCPSDKSSIKLSDSEVTGLKVRVTSNGIKSFIFEKRPKGTGKLKLETIGRVSDISIEQARAIAREKALDFSDPNYLFRLAERKAKLSFAEAFSPS